MNVLSRDRNTQVLFDELISVERPHQKMSDWFKEQMRHLHSEDMATLLDYALLQSESVTLKLANINQPVTNLGSKPKSFCVIHPHSQVSGIVSQAFPSD